MADSDIRVAIDEVFTKGTNGSFGHKSYEVRIHQRTRYVTLHAKSKEVATKIKNDLETMVYAATNNDVVF